MKKTPVPFHNSNSHNKTFLFLGDSITDSEHLWLPEYHNLGNGFVHMLSSRFQENNFHIKCINKGQDGFTTSSLLRILPQVLTDLQPDYIHLLIGINDVGVAMNTGTTLEQLDFCKSFQQIIQLLSASNAQIFCSGPFLFPHPARRIHWIPSVFEAESIISQLSEEYDIPFSPLHDMLNVIASEKGFDYITTDGIHLTENGHQILADKIYSLFTDTTSME